MITGKKCRQQDVICIFNKFQLEQRYILRVYLTFPKLQWHGLGQLIELQLLHLPQHPRFLPGLLNLKDILKGLGPWLLILDGLHDVHPKIHLYPVHHPIDGCFIFIGKLVISLLKVLAKMSFLASCRVSSLVSC